MIFSLPVNYVAKEFIRHIQQPNYVHFYLFFRSLSTLRIIRQILNSGQIIRSKKQQ